MRLSSLGPLILGLFLLLVCFSYGEEKEKEISVDVGDVDVLLAHFEERGLLDGEFRSLFSRSLHSYSQKLPEFGERKEEGKERREIVILEWIEKEFGEEIERILKEREGGEKRTEEEENQTSIWKIGTQTASSFFSFFTLNNFLYLIGFGALCLALVFVGSFLFAVFGQKFGMGIVDLFAHILVFWFLDPFLYEHEKALFVNLCYIGLSVLHMFFFMFLIGESHNPKRTNQMRSLGVLVIFSLPIISLFLLGYLKQEPVEGGLEPTRWAAWILLSLVYGIWCQFFTSPPFQDNKDVYGNEGIFGMLRRQFLAPFFVSLIPVVIVLSFFPISLVSLFPLSIDHSSLSSVHLLSFLPLVGLVTICWGSDKIDDDFRPCGLISFLMGLLAYWTSDILFTLWFQTFTIFQVIIAVMVGTAIIHFSTLWSRFQRHFRGGMMGEIIQHPLSKQEIFTATSGVRRATFLLLFGLHNIWMSDWQFPAILFGTDGPVFETDPFFLAYALILLWGVLDVYSDLKIWFYYPSRYSYHYRYRRSWAKKQDVHVWTENFLDQLFLTLLSEIPFLILAFGCMFGRSNLSDVSTGPQIMGIGLMCGLCLCYTWPLFHFFGKLYSSQLSKMPPIQVDEDDFENDVAENVVVENDAVKNEEKNEAANARKKRMQQKEQALQDEREKECLRKKTLFLSVSLICLTFFFIVIIRGLSLSPSFLVKGPATIEKIASFEGDISDPLFSSDFNDTINHEKPYLGENDDDVFNGLYAAVTLRQMWLFGLVFLSCFVMRLSLTFENEGLSNLFIMGGSFPLLIVLKALFPSLYVPGLLAFGILMLMLFAMQAVRKRSLNNSEFAQVLIVHGLLFLLLGFIELFFLKNDDDVRSSDVSSSSTPFEQGIFSVPHFTYWAFWDDPFRYHFFYFHHHPFFPLFTPFLPVYALTPYYFLDDFFIFSSLFAVAYHTSLFKASFLLVGFSTLHTGSYFKFLFEGERSDGFLIGATYYFTLMSWVLFGLSIACCNFPALVVGLLFAFIRFDIEDSAHSSDFKGVNKIGNRLTFSLAILAIVVLLHDDPSAFNMVICATYGFCGVGLLVFWFFCMIDSGLQQRIYEKEKREENFAGVPKAIYQPTQLISSCFELVMNLVILIIGLAILFLGRSPNLTWSAFSATFASPFSFFYGWFPFWIFSPFYIVSGPVFWVAFIVIDIISWIPFVTPLFSLIWYLISFAFFDHTLVWIPGVFVLSLATPSSKNVSSSLVLMALILSARLLQIEVAYLVAIGHLFYSALLGLGKGFSGGTQGFHAFKVAKGIFLASTRALILLSCGFLSQSHLIVWLTFIEFTVTMYRYFSFLTRSIFRMVKDFTILIVPVVLVAFAYYAFQGASLLENVDFYEIVSVYFNALLKNVLGDEVTSWFEVTEQPNVLNYLGMIESSIASIIENAPCFLL